MSPNPTPLHDHLTVRQARDRFFVQYGFGADGGYGDDWSEAAFGPVMYRVPNWAARAAALQVHDLHHVATGYSADWQGEAQISAWELGSGAGRYPYAWIIALWGLFTGLVGLPLDTLRAFVRGRRSTTNLYAAPFDGSTLDDSVQGLRSRLGVPSESRSGYAVWAGDVGAMTRWRDVVTFGAWSGVALAFGVIAALPVLGFVAFAYARTILAAAMVCPGCMPCVRAA